MGKTKKVKKGSKDEDIESDTEIKQKIATSLKTKSKQTVKTEEATSTTDEEVETKKSVKNKNEPKNDASEISKNMKNLKMTSKQKKKNEIGDSDEDSNEEKNITKVKSQPMKKVGFSLLQMDSSDELDSPSDKEDIPKSDEEEKPIVKSVKKQNQSEKNKEQTGKKGKKARRKRDESDEDIDKVLAELEMEYTGVKKDIPASEETIAIEKSEEVAANSKKKNKKDERKISIDSGEALNDEGEKQPEDTESSTVKSAAQKKKEKKEREKLKKAAKKQVSSADEPKDEISGPTATEDNINNEKVEIPITEDAESSVQESKKKKKVEKADKSDKVDDKEKKKGPAKKTIAAMQDALKKLKEEEERLEREEEERIRREDEREVQRLEAIRLEQEKKDKKKKKEKERKERLKAEGKLLTSKQKADKARAQAMLESLKAQGVDVSSEPKKARPGTRIKPNKLKQQLSQEQEPQENETSDKIVEVQIVDKKVDDPKASEIKLEKEDAVKDSWDADSSSEEEQQVEETKTATKAVAKVPHEKKANRNESSDESESDDDDDEESDDSESSSESDDHMTDAERNRQKAIQRIEKRQEENEKNKSSKVLRAAVVCVLGHVDTGKTKILDKLRRTHVQDGEAGGITQQIGATNVPIENIKEQTRHVKAVNEIDFKIPGLLIIDTPGHESFSNLRNRGSSLCDLAILVVDIMHGLEPQTIESINLLKSRKTPFLVALNKIDRLYDWQSAQRKDIRDILKAQHSNTQAEFERRTKDVILQFAEQGLNAALFSENPDPRTYVSLVPTSAVTGEGMGNLLALIVHVCEGPLHKRLIFTQTLQATVLEVKAIPGLGTTIDTILINGTLHEGDTVVLAGTDGPIVTQIRSLLMPQPMKELRVKNAYIEYKEVVAAQGVKIAAKDLEKAIAGLNLLVAQKPDEVEILRDEVAKELKSALSGIRLSERGVYVQASTLGSLEALLEFLRTSKIPYSAIRIGPVVKRDVMKASAMLEHDSQFATILAFDVKIERDAQEMAENLGVKIFQADIIYHLFDKFIAYRDELKQKKRDEFKSIAVFPCKIKVLPQFVFNSRDPIVCGVMIEAGIVKEGTPICVPSREFVEIGIVTSIENNHKQVESARKGQEVCIKIEPISGESPKMFGRHFDETDMLVSKITRQSIDACKDYFRDDLLKTDWQLMVELKKMFSIL